MGSRFRGNDESPIRSSHYLSAGTVAAVLAAWWLLSATQVIPPTRFPSPREVWEALRQVIEAARTLGVSRTMMVREVLIPGAMPHIFTGLRLSLQACWTTLVAGELIGAAAGLGHVLQQSALDLFPAMILVGMVFVALAGALMTWALSFIERRAMPWRS